ncbi:MAG: hypothetical protein AAF415_06260 [Pseudomonadota bacterium]
MAQGSEVVTVLCERLLYLSATFTLVFSVLTACSREPVIKQETEAELQAVTDKVAQRISGRTSITNSRQHGPQVEYATKDGRVFLWYPGNEQIVPGEWKTRINPDFLSTKLSNGNTQVTRRSTLQSGRIYTSVADICYRYGANTYNPATKKRGGTWECQLAAFALPRSNQTIAGDPFELENRTDVPFVTEKNTETYRMLRKQAGFN